MKKALTTIISAIGILVSMSGVHAADAASGKGTINKIDTSASSINISHEAIPDIGWHAMTMDIKVADKKILSGLKAGQMVTFDLTKDARAGYIISRIAPSK